MDAYIWQCCDRRQGSTPTVVPARDGFQKGRAMNIYGIPCIPRAAREGFGQSCSNALTLYFFLKGFVLFVCREPAFSVDLLAIEGRYKALQKKLHPDMYATKPKVSLRTQTCTASFKVWTGHSAGPFRVHSDLTRRLER